MTLQALHADTVMPALDLQGLTENVPHGEWAAISSTRDRLVAHAGTVEEAIRKARDQGEDKPLIVHVPEMGATSVCY